MPNQERRNQDNRSVDVTDMPERAEPARASHDKDAGVPDTSRQTPADDRNDRSLPIIWLVIIIMGVLLINGYLFLRGFFSNLLTG